MPKINLAVLFFSSICDLSFKLIALFSTKYEGHALKIKLFYSAIDIDRILVSMIGLTGDTE